MKPDKIYIPSEIMDVPKNIFDTKPSTGATEYVRKDALMEWLEGCKNNPVITDLQKSNIQELIDKLNSM